MLLEVSKNFYQNPANGPDDKQCYDDLGCFYPMGGFFEVTWVLPMTPEYIQARYLLFSRENAHLGLANYDYQVKGDVKIEEDPRFDKNLETVVIIHGFQDGYSEEVNKTKNWNAVS